MATLGFIGLGRMGSPMAANLLAAGHSLAVYARRPEAATPIEALGALRCVSAREVAARSDVVFTMVTDGDALEALVGGDDGLLAGARPGLVLIDHSTIAPGSAIRIASRLEAHGVEMLDAPVSGGVAGARAGTLSIMVGGDEAVYARCRPLLLHLGTTVVHLGATGLGQVAKACNQICILATQLGVAESVLVARRSGLDFDKAKDALMGGFAASRVLDMQGPKMAHDRFDGEIESRLHHKDILIALAWSAELGLDLPASRLSAALLSDLQEAGGASLDSAAVVTVMERSGGTKAR